MKKKFWIVFMIITIIVSVRIVTNTIHTEYSKISKTEENSFIIEHSIEENKANNEIVENYLIQEAESQNTEENKNIEQTDEERNLKEVEKKSEMNDKAKVEANQTQKKDTNDNETNKDNKNTNNNNLSSEKKEDNTKNNTTNSKENLKSNDTKGSSNKTNTHVHSQVGTMGKWFTSFEELVAEYNRECEKWEKLYTNKKITKDEFNKNYPHRLYKCS